MNVEEAWKWYIKHFGMDCRIFEDEAEAKLMLPYTGGQPRSRHAVWHLTCRAEADSKSGSIKAEILLR